MSFEAKSIMLAALLFLPVKIALRFMIGDPITKAIKKHMKEGKLKNLLLSDLHASGPSEQPDSR